MMFLLVCLVFNVRRRQRAPNCSLSLPKKEVTEEPEPESEAHTKTTRSNFYYK